MTPGGERSGAGGRTCRVRPGGKGLGGNGLGGLVWVWVGLAWARYLAPSLPTAAAAAAAGEAPVACAGSFSRFCDVLGAAAWPAEAVARLAGAAVATPRAPSPLPSAAAAALGDAPGSCAGATPRVGGVPGAAVGAAAWLAGAAVSAPRVSGAPSWGGVAGLAAWAAGSVTSAGSGSWVDGPVSAEAARGCPAGGPTRTAASASLLLLALHGGLPRPLRGDGGAGAGPAVVAVVPLGGAIRVCHHCYPGRHAWWQVRPSHYLPVHQCRAVGSAVQCSAGRRGGGAGGPAVASAPYGRGPGAIHRHTEGRQGSHAAHASHHSSQSGAGLRALGPRGLSGGAGGSRTRWTPLTAVTSCVRRKVCGGGDPQDPFRVPAGRDDEDEQGGARALLPEDLPPVVGTPGSGEGGEQVWVGPVAGRVRRRREGGAPGGLPGERLAYDGVRGGRPGAVAHRVGRPGAGGRLVRAFHEHRDFAHLQVLVQWV